MGTVIANNSHQSDRTVDRSKAVQAGMPSRRFQGRILNRQTAEAFAVRASLVKTTSPKTIGVMLFEQMTAAELTGPAEAFPRVNY
jgi:ribosomal protein L21E